MASLNNIQKQLLFDYSIGVASEQQEVEAEELIASSSEAAEFYYNTLRLALSPLDALEVEPCPEELAERVMRSLLEEAAKDHVGRQPVVLPAAEQQPVLPLKAWRPTIQIAAMAAILLFLFSVTFPSIRFMRQKAYQTQCQSNLGTIYQGLVNYISDHDSPPTITRVAGSPWWKVGYQGVENHSNTRVVWLLPKNGYVEPATFTCPGRSHGRVLDYNNLQPEVLRDFPSRDYIDYSFRVSCDQAPKNISGHAVLMADLNPLSEKLPTDFSQPFKIRLDESILNRQSINHNRRGQNVLTNDGSVAFRRSRLVTATGDDIFTLSGMASGSEVKGCETPSCETDAFLAP